MCSDNKDELVSFHPKQGTLKTPGRMRYNLFTEWASFRKTFKFQPIDAVRDYYGVKVALYFAWLGFYTSMVSGRGYAN